MRDLIELSNHGRGLLLEERLKDMGVNRVSAKVRMNWRVASAFSGLVLKTEAGGLARQELTASQLVLEKLR